MKTAELILSAEELRSLASLEGCNWRRYGADVLFDGDVAFIDMFIESSTEALTLSVQESPLDLQGWPDDLTRLRVSRGAAGLAEALRKGNLYYQGQGRRIVEVLLARDTYRGTVGGHPAFELVIDVGVVFVLDSGCIAVCKGGPFTDDLVISRASDLGSLRLPGGLEQWTPDLEHSYEHRRDVLLLRDLLAKE